MLCVAEPHVPVTVLGYSLCRVPQLMSHSIELSDTSVHWHMIPLPTHPTIAQCLWILSQHTCVQVCRCVWSDCDIVECGEGTLPFPSFSSIFLWGYGEWRGISSPFSCVVISFPVESSNDVPWIFQTRQAKTCNSQKYRVTEWAVCIWMMSKFTHWYIRDVCSVASRAKGYQALPLRNFHCRHVGREPRNEAVRELIGWIR